MMDFKFYFFMFALVILSVSCNEDQHKLNKKQSLECRVCHNIASKTKSWERLLTRKHSSLATRCHFAFTHDRMIAFSETMHEVKKDKDLSKLTHLRSTYPDLMESVNQCQKFVTEGHPQSIIESLKTLAKTPRGVAISQQALQLKACSKYCN